MISKTELLFQQWVASLVNKDRTKKAIQGNFEELFLSLKAEGLVLEAAYEYLGRAVKAHQPSSSLVRNVYKKFKNSGNLDISEKEFAESWNKDIAEKANAAFFEVFPVEVKVELEEPIIYGSMTVKEYKAQRQHADSYPQLDTDKLEQQMKDGMYDPMQDLSALLEAKSGNSK